MDRQLIACIKSLAIDMISEAESGHPGIVLSSAPILYSLYKNHLNINPNDDKWYNRDRFIMSAGHGSALLYATLYYAGYDLSLDDLKNFRKAYSKCPGHPEVNVTSGVECSTGPLGEGIATAVGMAIGSKYLNNGLTVRDNKKIVSPIDFNVYVLVGDGDLMEGLSYEACSLAGTLKLDNLIVIYDSNNMTLDGSTDVTFKENVCARFEAMGFDTFKVSDGNNLKQLNYEITKAKRSKKPSLIEVKTHLGYGSLLQDTNEVHGSPLTLNDIIQLKEKLKVPNEKFYVDEKLKNDFIFHIASRVGEKYNYSSSIYKIIEAGLDSDYKDFKFYFKDLNYNISKYKWDTSIKGSLRDINKYVLSKIALNITSIIGGSADLNSSTKAYLSNLGDMSLKNYSGRNIWYGIREGAMGAISNGLALLKFRPFQSTFLTFSDYLKPAMRLSCLMHLGVINIFTHDAVTIGKDGPTHQPIEQLSTLREIPSMYVYRPSDLKEIIGTYQSILNNPSKTASVIISRGKEIRLKGTSAKEALKGGYIVKKEKGKLKGIIVSTGTDLITAYKISEVLDTKGIYTRVVSMVCLELFMEQSEEYQKSVLDSDKIIFIEASNSLKFTKYTSYDNIINIKNFGISAGAEDVLKHLNFDIESILKNVLKRLK